MHSTNGDALENLVMAILEENDLKIDHIRGQGDDGAANMNIRDFSQRNCP